MKLADRIAIVTGAAKGMGRDICLTLAREGAHLTLAAREPAPLETLAHEVEALGRRALAVPTDVTDEAAVERHATVAAAAQGRLERAETLVPEEDARRGDPAAETRAA